jgi:hypothetical protein
VSLADRYVGLLPRDLVHDGKSLTEVYRQHSRGGAIVYVRNRLPGKLIGHEFYVFQIDIVEGREQLGKQLTIQHSVDQAINVAANHSVVVRPTKAP